MRTSPRYPGTAAGGGGSGSPWSNPDYIKIDDTDSASGDISGPAYYSGELIGSNFGFAIPTALKIVGISVEIDKVGSRYYTSVYLQKSGGANSIDRGSSPTSVTGSVATFGGPTDLWGFTSITAAEINNSGFAAIFSAQNTSGGGNISVNYMRVTVYYAPADKAYDPSIRKVYHGKVYQSDGTYKGLLPNIYDTFQFADEIDTAGSDITILVASSSETARIDTASPLLAEDGTNLLAESGDTLLSETSSSLVGIGADNNMIVNGNTVVMYEFSPYYPNGRPAFRGRIDKWNDSGNRISINLKSDGQDLDNSPLTGPPYVYTVDQQQVSVDSSDTLFESPGWQREGQTWTANVDNLAAIYLRLYPTASSTVTVSVYDTPSMNTFLGSSSVAVTSTGGAPTDVIVPFGPRIPTVAGTQYFFTVKTSTSTGLPIAYQNSNVYAGGSRYSSSYSGGSGGGGYAVDSGSDLWFKTASGVGATAVTYGTQDPIGGMLVTAMNDYIGTGGLITYTAASIQASAVSVPYNFNLATMLEAINKFKALAPANYYWFVNRGTNLLTMKPAATTPDFIFIKGRHIADIDVTPTVEQVKNIIYFTGGEITAPGSSTAAPGSGINLYKIFKDQASIDRYGPRIDRLTDNRVTVQATASAIGGSALASQKDEKYMATVEIVDTTMDISLLEPGKTVGFAGFNNYKDRLVLQISRRNYRPHSAILSLGVLPVRQNQSVEQITRQLIAEQTVANPATPS